MQTETHRAVARLHAYSRRYPQAWRMYAEMQASPPMQWPSWCWMPLAGTYAVISGGGDSRLTPAQAADVGVLGAMAAWRVTQGIYRLRPELLAGLLDTPVAGDMPADALTRLPEWCVYVELPSERAWPWGATHGAWAYIEHDATDGRAELRIVLDVDRDPPLQLIVHMGGSVRDGLRAATKEARIQALRSGAPESAPAVSVADDAQILHALSGIVSVVLYLCERRDRTPPPLPRVVRVRGRPYLPAAQAPTVHMIGGES